MAGVPQRGAQQHRCWQAPGSALASLPMNTQKKTGGKRKLPPRPSDAAIRAARNLLVAGDSTREENRVAVRLLLRQASRNLERSK
jgi:hypothetical protein